MPQAQGQIATEMTQRAIGVQDYKFAQQLLGQGLEPDTRAVLEARIRQESELQTASTGGAHPVAAKIAQNDLEGAAKLALQYFNGKDFKAYFSEDSQ